MTVLEVIKELLDLAEKRFMFTYGKVDLARNFQQALGTLLDEADRCDVRGALDTARHIGKLEETTKVHAGKRLPEERIRKHAQEFGPEATGDPWPVLEEAIDRAFVAAAHRFEQVCGFKKIHA